MSRASLDKNDTKAVEEKLWSFVLPEPNSGCWLWDGSCGSHGYGQMRLDGGPKLAHRLMYEIVKGEIPDGLWIDHLCRVRSCVNPHHLEAVTPLENINRGMGPALTRLRRKTHCKHGHEFTEQNTFYYTSNRGNLSRGCSICRRQYPSARRVCA